MYYFSTDPYKTLHMCHKFVGLALNGLFKRNAATFVFGLGYTALNIHVIWPGFCRESIYFTLELR